MKKIIILLLVVLVTVSVVSGQPNHYYKIALQYNDGDITYNSLMVIPNQGEQQSTEGDYVVEVISFDNMLLYEATFSFSLAMMYDTIDEETGEIIDGGVIVFQEAQETLIIPYYENAKEINIYDADASKKLSIDVSGFGKEKEQKEDLFATQAYEKDETKEIESSLEVFWDYIFIGFAILLFAIFLFIVIKRRLNYLHEKRKK